MTKQTTPYYRVSSYTANLVEALRALMLLQESFYEALTAMYGKNEGDRMYNEEHAIFDAVSAKIGQHLVFSISSVLSLNKEETTEI